MQSWYGSGECSLCDANIGDTNDVLAMFGSGEQWCSGENGKLSDTAQEFLGKMTPLQKVDR